MSGNSNALEVPASPVLVAFARFDGTTGALAPGSWGVAAPTVTTPAQDFLFPVASGFGASAPAAIGDLFADVRFQTVAGAGYRDSLQIWGAGTLQIQIIDAAAALAALPANTIIFVSIYRRNAAIQ